MMDASNSKITAEHLRRMAYVYVRQSTVRQVFENTESTARQYALGQKALALGWTPEQVIVEDGDLGLSGAGARDRAGFQRLVTEISMGRVGIVLGLEVSRLARNSADWHRLLELCALNRTLILDQDGFYDPTDFNDRLVLGLKGTMSEAELHIMRGRLREGMRNKARRGDLRLRLPVGFLYDAQGRVVLDPDQQVQQSIRVLFDTYRRTGTAGATVRVFREQGLEFPLRLHTGPRKEELHWRELVDSRVMGILHNPHYAGAYCYGRRRQERRAGTDKLTLVSLPQDQWQVLIHGAHEGYITWEEYEQNQRQLTGNRTAAAVMTGGAPREGTALLTGLAVCGICGARMTVRYHQRHDQSRPTYYCKGAGNNQSLPGCQSLAGVAVDAAIGRLLCDVVKPAALELTLAVQEELQHRREEADRLRRKQVERGEYEANLARHRYMKTDPDNRLVADNLEAEWNEKLRLLAAAREEYERRSREDRLTLDADKQERIRALTQDFPRLWHDPKTADLQRKRMARLILEDVTLIRDEGGVAVHVRFKGGAARSLHLPPPRRWWHDRKVAAEVVAEIDCQMDHHTYRQIAAILNEKKMRSGVDQPFDAERVKRVARARGLRSRRQRLRAAGLLTLKEMAVKLGLSTSGVKHRRLKGRLGVRAYQIDDVGSYMYEDPGEQPSKGTTLSRRGMVNSGVGGAV